MWDIICKEFSTHAYREVEGKYTHRNFVDLNEAYKHIRTILDKALLAGKISDYKYRATEDKGRVQFLCVCSAKYWIINWAPDKTTVISNDRDIVSILHNRFDLALNCEDATVRAFNVLYIYHLLNVYEFNDEVHAMLYESLLRGEDFDSYWYDRVKNHYNNYIEQQSMRDSNLIIPKPLWTDVYEFFKDYYTKSKKLFKESLGECVV